MTWTPMFPQNLHAHDRRNRILRHLKTDRDFQHRIVASDLHIDGSDSRYPYIRLLCEIIEEEDPDLLVLAGDIGDPWADPWESILASKSWRCLKSLCEKRYHEIPMRNTVWILDNHDHNGKKGYLGNVWHCRSFEDSRIIYRHGWEFDWTWSGIGRIPGVSRLAFWLSDHFPWLMVPIHKAFFRGRGISTSNLSDLHRAAVLSAARKYGQKRGKVTVFGHIHDAILAVTEYGCAAANSGDSVTSMTYLDISVLRQGTLTPKIVHYTEPRAVDICRKESER